MATSGMRLSEVPVRSNATCCGESQVAPVAGRVGMRGGEDSELHPGQVTCSPFLPTTGEVHVKSRGQGSLEGEGSCRVLLIQCRVGAGVNRVVANYRDGRGFGGGASSSRPPALAFPAAARGLWAEGATTPCCVWLRSHPPQRPHSDASAA